MAILIGLLGQFNGAHHTNESIVCMTTDLKNEYLITGKSLSLLPDKVVFASLHLVTFYSNNNFL